MSAPDFERRAEWLRNEVAQGQAGAARHHPDLEEMAAYAEGGLDEGRRAEIGEHLVACASCARFALDLAKSVEAAAALPPPSAAESAARWERLHPRLVEEGFALPKPAPVMAAVTGVAARPMSASANGWRFRAAGLTMALLASLAYNGWQWKVANEPLLVEEEVQLANTRGEPEALPIPIGERSRRRVLELRIEAASIEPLPGLRAEILTWPEKKLVWSGEIEREGSQLTLAIPTSFLERREYRVRLSGRTATGWTHVGTHAIRITEPSP